MCPLAEGIFPATVRLTGVVALRECFAFLGAKPFSGLKGSEVLRSGLGQWVGGGTMKIQNYSKWFLAVLIMLISPGSLAQWVQTSGPSDGTVRCLVLNGTNLFAGTRGGVFRSTNEGTTWTAASSGLTNLAVWALLFSGTNLFAGTHGGGVCRSTDDGASWIPVNVGLTDTNVESLGLLGMNLFAGTGHGIFLSTNIGASWAPVDSGIPTNLGVTSLTSQWTILYAGIPGGGVYRSTNAGTTWSATNNGLTNSSVWVVVSNGTRLYAGTVGGGVFHSPDSATSWSPYSSGLADTVVYSLAVSGTRVFAGTYRNGAFLSTDEGSTWSPVNTGLTNLYVRSMCVGDTVLYAGTYGNGVWRRPLAEMTTSVRPVSDGLPKQIALAQNYPNPFNPATTIQYSIPEDAHVLLSVYNTLGQQVASLVDEVQQAGNHVVRFDGDRLSSGVYFYQLLIGRFIATKQMLLIK